MTEAVRTSEVTAVTRYAADNPQVREHLVQLQRTLAGRDNVVTEGRDQGTVAFPKAECKIFLTASPEERARRRLSDLQSQGEPVTLEQVLAAQRRRDREDASRPVGPVGTGLRRRGSLHRRHQPRRSGGSVGGVGQKKNDE